VWLAIVAIFSTPMVAFAHHHTTGAAGLDLTKLIMGLAGGLAIFLFGMELMGDSLKQVAGDRMRKIIGALSTNRFAGVATGATTTAVVQSSSVTTVMVVGFITAGMMTMPQALSVILGANIGTTITGQIIAFKVTQFSLAFVAAGFFTYFIVKKPVVRKWALAVLGLGLVFFGLTLMGDAMKPLRSLQEFQDLMAGDHSLFVAVLIGAAFTALVQSSSATTGIVIVMASDGLIPLETGIALALGANIGTCVTAGLAAIGKPREAVRAAVGHAVFNIVGVLLITPFIPQFTAALGWMFSGAETARQIANAHTVFNVANTIAFLPFLGFFAKTLNRLIPEKRSDETIETNLQEALVKTPAMAIALAKKEVRVLADTAKAMLAAVPPLALRGDTSAAVTIGALYDEAIRRHAAVSSYLTQVATSSMSEEDAQELIELTRVATRVRSIANILRHALPNHEPATLTGRSEQIIRRYHQSVARALDISIVAFDSKDAKAAASVLAIDHELREMDRTIDEGQRVPVSIGTTNLAMLNREASIAEDLRRVYHHAAGIARTIAPQMRAEVSPGVRGEIAA
jgi:phosphate:Na+ symporter